MVLCLHCKQTCVSKCWWHLVVSGVSSNVCHCTNKQRTNNCAVFFFSFHSIVTPPLISWRTYQIHNTYLLLSPPWKTFSVCILYVYWRAHCKVILVYSWEPSMSYHPSVLFVGGVFCWEIIIQINSNVKERCMWVVLDFGIPTVFIVRNFVWIWTRSRMEVLWSPEMITFWNNLINGKIPTNKEELHFHRVYRLGFRNNTTEAGFSVQCTRV